MQLYKNIFLYVLENLDLHRYSPLSQIVYSFFAILERIPWKWCRHLTGPSRHRCEFHGVTSSLSLFQISVSWKEKYSQLCTLIKEFFLEIFLPQRCRNSFIFQSYKAPFIDLALIPLYRWGDGGVGGLTGGKGWVCVWEADMVEVRDGANKRGIGRYAGAHKTTSNM